MVRVVNITVYVHKQNKMAINMRAHNILNVGDRVFVESDLAIQVTRIIKWEICINKKNLSLSCG